MQAKVSGGRQGRGSFERDKARQTGEARRAQALATGQAAAGSIIPNAGSSRRARKEVVVGPWAQHQVIGGVAYGGL